MQGKQVKTKDILVVYSRHLAVQKVCEDAESTYPDGWEKLTKADARKGIFKDLAQKFPMVDGPEKVYARMKAAAAHPLGEAGHLTPPPPNPLLHIHTRPVMHFLVI